MFFYYLIYYLAKFDKPIIYTIKDKFIKFLSDDIWKGKFKEDLQNKEIWYIVDIKDLKYINARIVLISFSNLNIGKKYKKNKFAYYMFIWSL